MKFLTIAKKMKLLQTFFINRFQLPSDDWNLISQNFKQRTLLKGEFFIEQGKTCKNSGFILEGVMRYFSCDNEGNDPTCYFSYENHYITDPFTFRKQLPSDMNLQAVTRCNIVDISLELDKELQTTFPRWNDITNQLLLDVAMNFANQKELLAMSASKRYDYFIEKFPTIANRVPLQYIASYLGIKQPSLSRVRKKILP
jgi:hypothetical protein